MELLQLSLRPTDVTVVASVQNRLGGAVLAALLHFTAMMYFSAGYASALEKQPLTFIGGSGSHVITVEVARTEQERSTGLMFRRSIGDAEGMLFVYDREQEISMWMKNTYIPLDMIFVKRDGVIARIEANTEPFSENIVSSDSPVLVVIEMGGGSARRLGLKPGDRVQHPAFK